MTSTKASQIFKDIEIARCKGDWQAIPDLVRRYKKHGPKNPVFEESLLVEAALAQKVAVLEANRCLEHRHDTPENHIAVDSRLAEEHVKPLVEKLESALQQQTSDHSDVAMHAEFAKIILARCHYECGYFQETVDIVEQLSFNKDDVSSGYGQVLFLQARAMKAVSYEILGRIESALQSHLGIVSLLDSSSGNGGGDTEFIAWAEEALYRAVLLSVRPDTPQSQQSALDIVRAYHSVTASQPLTWRTHKRLVAVRHSSRFMSEQYREGKYIPPAIDTNGTSLTHQQTFASEIMHMHTIHEKLLLDTAQFPRAGESNSYLLEFIDQFAMDLDLIDASGYHMMGYIEVLNRVSQYTFNSPRLSRHLFHALVRLGDYDEALHALRSYLYLVGLRSQAWDDSRLNGDALALDTKGNNVPTPPVNGSVFQRLVDESISSDSKHATLASSRGDGVESESTRDILNVLLSAVRMYCDCLQNGPAAVEMAELAKRKWDRLQDHLKVQWIRLGAHVERNLGAAYGLLAHQMTDAASRTSYYEKALEALLRSVELSSDNDEDVWKTYYQLALHYGETRDVGNAIQAVAKALQVNPGHIPSWHLLTLACSCPAQGDLQRALKTCAIGLREASFEEKAEEQLMLQMTENLVIGALEGPEAALAALEQLFAACGKLMTPEASHDYYYHHHRNGMVVSGSLGNLSDAAATSEQQQQQQQQRRRGLSIGTTHSSLSQLVVEPSRSHDGVRRNGLSNNRSRSASSFGQKQQAAAMDHLGIPSTEDKSDTASIKSTSSKHGLQLFSSKSTSRRKGSEQNANERRKGLPESASMNTIASSNASLSSVPACCSSQQSRLLSELWLLSASCFLKLGKLEEALKAVEEAENADRCTNPRVWCMLGRIHLASQDLEEAMEALDKGLMIDPNSVECRVWLAQAHMALGRMETAEGLLEPLTKSVGWDCAEAWYHLGNIYCKTGRADRGKHCLLYALELESTSPVQSFSILPRCV